MSEDIMDYNAMKLAVKYYNETQLTHALRVAQYAVDDNPFAEWQQLSMLWRVGILHSILEDTNCSWNECEELMTNIELEALKLLTHNENDTEQEHLIRIALDKNAYAKAIARADIKDYLYTLNDTLLQNYYPVVKYVL